MAEPRVALVTGGNRGIGLEICRQLADRGLEVVLTGRDEQKARAACRRLWEEGLDTVIARPLDVTSETGVERLRERMEREIGRVDVLVNNAGVVLDGHRPAAEADLALVRASMETNAYGPLRLAVAFLPLMRRHGYGRIVNVSTGMAGLTEMGGGSPGYRMSKAALNAVTRMLAAETAGENVLVNSAAPGWVRTDMGGPDARESVEEGADTPVWLATLPDGGPTGGFFRSREPIRF